MQALIDFFGVKDFIPHGYCLAWNPALLWTTVISNATLVLAYGSYPIGIAYFVWKRKDLRYRWLYLSFFNGFILTCATTHLFKVVTVWLPVYWLAAYVDALAAAVAVATVFAIRWVIPRALSLPSPAEFKVQLSAANSAAKYARSLIEASLDPLITISPEGKIIDINQATEHAIGIIRRELIGTDFSDYFTEPDKAREGYQQVLREGSVTDYPLTLRHVSGKVMEVLYNASVYRNEKGEVVGVFAAARDITERKRTEERVHYLAGIVESSDDAIIGKTLEGIITSWNKGAEKMYGYSASEAISQPVSILIPPFHEDELPHMLEEIKANKHGEHVETIRRRKDGKIIHVSLSVFPISKSDGVIVGLATVARDISARKQTEKDLLSASLYSRSLIEASMDPLVTISAEGKITDVNEATIKATGVDREALIGSDFSDYFTDPDKAREGYKQVFAEGFVKDYPLTLRHVSGKVTEVLYNARVYHDNKGEVAGVFAAARDVTERNRSEEQIRERSEEQIRERIKELQVFFGLSEISERESITLEVLYQELVNILPNSWRHSEIACARIMMDDIDVCTDNFRVSEWMQEAPIKVHGKVAGKVEVGYLEQEQEQDEGPFIKEERRLINAIAERVGHITEHKKTEQEVMQLSLRNQLILDSAGEGIYGLDIDGRCTFVNPAASQMLGFAVDELDGHSHSMLHHSKQDGSPNPPEEYPIIAAYKQGTVHRGEDMFWRKDGSSFPVEFISTPILEAGKITGAVVAFRDITDHKRDEEALRQLNAELEERVLQRTAELAAANKELEAFAYSVSHDLRAPLRSIDGFSQALLEDYAEKIDAEGKDYLQRVRGATQRMGQLIDDLLNLSRVTRAELVRTTVDLSALARKLATELQQEEPDRKVEFVIQDDMTVKGDGRLLRVVLENLFGNAWKYTSRHASARIEFGQADAAGKSVWFVRDDGAGFDMEYAGNLFAPFQRLHSTEAFPGNGIGLTIVYRIIQRHGGTVWGEGAVERGAVFYFSLN